MAVRGSVRTRRRSDGARQLLVKAVFPCPLAAGLADNDTGLRRIRLPWPPVACGTGILPALTVENHGEDPGLSAAAADTAVPPVPGLSAPPADAAIPVVALAADGAAADAAAALPLVPDLAPLPAAQAFPRTGVPVVIPVPGLSASAAGAAVPPVPQQTGQGIAFFPSGRAHCPAISSPHAPQVCGIRTLCAAGLSPPPPSPPSPLPPAPPGPGCGSTARS